MEIAIIKEAKNSYRNEVKKIKSNNKVQNIARYQYGKMGH